MLNFNPDQTVRFVATQPPKSPKLGPLQQPEPAGPWAWPGDDGQAEAASAVVSAAHGSAKTKDEYLDDSALRSNQRSIERHINDDHYVRHFQPGDFVLGGSAACVFAQIPVANPRWSAVIMTKDIVTNSLATATFRKPSEWRSGRLRIRFWFTSPVGAVTNFFVQASISAIRTGEVLPATTLVSLNAAYAGPAVANTRMFSGNVYTTTSFGADDESFSLRIARLSTNASDTNANDFDLLEAEVLHIPARQEST